LKPPDARLAANPESVQHDAGALTDRPSEKDVQITGLLKRLMGFEPTTLCMASSADFGKIRADFPANQHELGPLGPWQVCSQFAASFA
jgi:hypothetical protein